VLAIPIDREFAHIAEAQPAGKEYKLKPEPVEATT
jgi:hypothetical protein